MNLQEVKEYLRIDGDADDATIEMMMQAAEQFIIDAAGFYDPENPKVKILYALLMQDFYENRVFAVREADRQRLSQVDPFAAADGGASEGRGGDRWLILES